MKDSLLDDAHIGYIAESLKETFNLAGDTAELGVFQGGTSRFIAENNNGAIHHAYDTFEGIPEEDVYQPCHHKGEFAADIDYVQGVLNLPNIRIHKGLFPRTAVYTHYKFVHIDVDIYTSTRAGLMFFTQRMTPGGIIILDDLDWKMCQGVRVVCDEMGLMPEKFYDHGGRLRF